MDELVASADMDTELYMCGPIRLMDVVRRAWTERDALRSAGDGRSPGLDDFAADAGFGLRLGRIGLYWALPLSGHDDGINFFVRIGSRF